MRNPSSAVIFTAFVLVYFAIRVYWANRADMRPVRESRAFFLDKLNVALVGIFSMIVPLIALFTPVLERFDYPANQALVLISVPFLLGGLVAFWISHRDLGENWSVTLALKENHSLVTNGIFSRVRHPMYLAIWLCSIGQALCVPNLVGGLGGLATWAVLYFVRIDKEEQMMIEKFGDAYRDYMRRTKRLIPFVH